MYFWAPLILTLKNLCFSKYLILRIKAHRGSNKGSSPNIISQTIITTPSCMMMLFSNAFLVLQLQLATIYGDFWPRKTAERIKHLLHYWHICSADKLAKIGVGSYISISYTYEYVRSSKWILSSTYRYLRITLKHFVETGSRKCVLCRSSSSQSVMM